MNGSDWRDYEPQYETIQEDIKYIVNDFGFYYLWYYMSFLTKDYWVMVAILKIAYLTTLIKLTKTITPNWLATLGFLMPISLIFMLIQNPLRFMVALIFVNLSFLSYLKGRYLRFLLIGFFAIFFHATTAFFLVSIPLLRFSNWISTVSRIVLIALYLMVLFISSNEEILNTILFSAVGTVSVLYEGMKDYSSYTMEDNSSFFTLGSIINVFLFGIVLLLRDDVVRKYKDGSFIYGTVILYTFLQRICMMIPTGFRLVIPFGIFYAVFIVYSLKIKRKLAWIFVLYFSFQYPRKIWNSYDLIPYTNSIYYIVTDHLPFDERYNYHYDEFVERTGHSHDENRGETINLQNK